MKTYARLLNNPFCDVEIKSADELGYYKALKGSYIIVKY